MQLLLCVNGEVLLDQRWRKAVKSCRHGRMSGEKIPGPGGGQRDIERLVVFLHEIECTFQHRERCVALIEMTYFGTNPQRPKQSPTGYP
jgi:hypothetical protein